jgi:hypothetical protein
VSSIPLLSSTACMHTKRLLALVDNPAAKKKRRKKKGRKRKRTKRTKKKKKKRRKKKKKQLMNSGLCLFLNLGLTSTQVGSMVNILPKIQFKIFLNITNIPILRLNECKSNILFGVNMDTKKPYSTFTQACPL